MKTLIFMAVLVSGLKADIFDPRVFNYPFYPNTYADLVKAKVLTLDQAKAHWQDHGVPEGRRASGAFGVQDYLKRYEDVRNTCGNDYACGIQHYLDSGYAEGRLGYLDNDGGAYDRWTISDPKEGLYLSASARMGYAVDSMVWNNHEFINAWDHGRELQMAVTTGHGECYNPTEGGSGDDLQSPDTTSVVLFINATGNVLSTSNYAAFWMIPGEQHANPNPSCDKAINKDKVSQYQMNKTLTIGVKGQPRALYYVGEVLVPEDQDLIQYEDPTMYMNYDFTSFYQIDVKTGALTPINPDPPGEKNVPLVLATSDGSFATGVWSPDQPSPGYENVGYGFFHFELGDDPNSTNKWNVVFRTPPVKAGTVVSYRSYMCVGTLQDVQKCMVAVAA